MRSHSHRVRAVLLSGLLVASYFGDARLAAAQAPPAASAPVPGPASGGGNNTGRDIVIGVGIAIVAGIIWNLIQQATNRNTASGAIVNSPASGGEALGGSPQPASAGFGGLPIYRQGLPSAPSRAAGTGGRGRLPAGERRFVADHVIIQFSANMSPQAIDQIARRYNLTQLESRNFPLIGATLSLWRVGGRRSLTSVIGGLQNEPLVASAQRDQVFTLQQQAPQAQIGKHDSQWELGKLQLEEAHRLATGRGVLVAVIDSTVDVSHPDLDGTIVKGFDALGSEGKPQKHGTAMAGAIASHGTLLGIAPGARILAARAFDDVPDGAQGTSFAICKSIQWAADNRARVINMSFAGPTDPAVHRLLSAAFGKDMVLIAAAGNGGPRAAPAYPGSDGDVIAVTATDSEDHLSAQSNRGPYITVAAPGVGVLALSPDKSYQLATGTSLAAAEVSGIAALLLERKPSLKPSDVHNILTRTATPLGPATDFGAGLVNAYRAVTAADRNEQTKR
jgi:hypothetical protein